MSREPYECGGGRSHLAVTVPVRVHIRYGLRRSTANAIVAMPPLQARCPVLPNDRYANSEKLIYIIAVFLMALRKSAVKQQADAAT